MNYCIITTINEPTNAVQKLYELFGNNLIIVGDLKTPKDWDYNGISPINEPSKLYAPNNHYARKNLGYLYAIKNGAKLIYDTDDDNIPNDSFVIRDSNVLSYNSFASDGWFNVYKFFNIENLWPRGFPLKLIKKLSSYKEFIHSQNSSIQQGVSDGEPDIDAIARLVFNSDTTFKEDRSIYLENDTWCPFNSQSTWWFPKAFPLMYLPITASFRMTDIWRSFIAQRCLWEIGEGVTFHSPAEVYQKRNEHDLLKDFTDEISGYLNNESIVRILRNLELKKGVDYVGDNLLLCYKELVNNGIFQQEELNSVSEWINDYEKITRNLA